MAFPLLKHVIGIFGLMDASKKSLVKRIAKVGLAAAAASAAAAAATAAAAAAAEVQTYFSLFSRRAAASCCTRAESRSSF
jgi:hypothetical protein